MSFKVNAYDPTRHAYAARIKHGDWEKHRALISELHSAKTPRKVMLKRLRDEHDFTPTLGQLQAKCKEWNLKVYTKESATSHESSSHATTRTPSSPRHSSTSSSAPAFHLATESGFVQEWSDDYRVHPIISLPSHGDTALPATGLLANTVDSHWPIPENDTQCHTMLQAASFYQAINAYQHAFSIYRAVYLHFRKSLSMCNSTMVKTILFSACSAVTEHQRNIMHSVLCELGSSTEIDNLDTLSIQCLQTSALSMMSPESVETSDEVRGHATAYLNIFNASEMVTKPSATSDNQILLYQFEHALLMQEHNSRILQHLLDWCERAIDQLHREIDDIFVGYSSCEEEYHHRIAQVLSGYLLLRWHKRCDEDDDQWFHLLAPTTESSPCAFHFRYTPIQTFVALAFMVVDAVRYDPLCSKFSRADDNVTRMWFLDAAKLFKRGIRMLARLDERSRCALFSETYLQRFHSSIAFRQKAYHWSLQLPAIVDLIGMSLAQNEQYPPEFTPVTIADDLLSNAALASPETSHMPQQVQGVDIDANTNQAIPQPEISPVVLGVPPQTTSDCSSIASFVNTYHRTLKRKFDARSKSGRSTPGDMMSLTSSTDFKLGTTAPGGNGSEAESLWLLVTGPETIADSG